MGWTSDGFPDNDDQQAWDGGALEATNGQPSADDSDYDPSDTSVRAVVAQDFSTRRLPAMSDTARAPVIVRGNGVPMGTPFIKRRERPLTLRIAIFTLMACIIVTGIFAVSPLNTGQASAGSAFQALASSMIWNRQPGYFLYTTVREIPPKASP